MHWHALGIGPVWLKIARQKSSLCGCVRALMDMWWPDLGRSALGAPDPVVRGRKGSRSCDGGWRQWP